MVYLLSVLKPLQWYVTLELGTFWRFVSLWICMIQ